MKSEAFQDEWPSFAANCWGCGRSNEHGLQIKSYWDGNEAVCTWHPKEHHIAFSGILCGGIIATIIDCHCLSTANAAYCKEKGIELESISGDMFITGSVYVKFLRPTPVNKPINLRARIVEMGEKKIKVKCDLYSGKSLCSTGESLAIKIGK